MPRTGCGVLIAARMAKSLSKGKESGSLDRPAGHRVANPPLVAYPEIRVMRYFALVTLLLASAASAQLVPQNNSQPPAPTGKTPPIPAARDVPFPGTIQLTVDASDVTRGIFRIRERVPVTGAGDLVLLYPEMDSGRSRAARRHQQGRGLQFHRRREAARMGARHG